MKCFVTGATGFIGSFLVRSLLAQGHEVFAMIRNPEGDGSWRIANIMPHLHVVRADLNDLSELSLSIVSLRPDVIFHLAWEGVGSSARNSPTQLVQNVTSTLKLLEFCQLSGCKVFVGLGSQAEYGIADGILKESSVCIPTTAYGVAKCALSRLATKFGEITSTRVLWFRLFSAYGPKDDETHMIPHLINGLLDTVCPPLTPGAQMWDYLYVEDAVEAMIAASLCEDACGIYNLASGKTVSLRSIIESIRDLVAPGVTLHFGGLPYRPDQVMHLEADISRLSTTTGWNPKVGLNEGLAKTVNWFKERYINAGNIVANQ